jgi:hypothetical protein
LFVSNHNVYFALCRHREYNAPRLEIGRGRHSVRRKAIGDDDFRAAMRAPGLPHTAHMSPKGDDGSAITLFRHIFSQDGWIHTTRSTQQRRIKCSCQRSRPRQEQEHDRPTHHSFRICSTG